MTIRWLTAFIDRPREGFEQAAMFWAQVTGSTLSSRRGEHDEFATLVPADGDAYLRLQHVAEGPGGCHLDLHVEDRAETVRRSEELGAVVMRRLDDVVVLRSPAGFPYCIIGYNGESVRPQPTRLDDGPRVLVDQLCIDVPADKYQGECNFWATLTGWERRKSRLPEFSHLRRPPGMPLRLLFQRLRGSAPGQPATAHLDLSCDDVETAAVLHEELGGGRHARFPYWIVMTDPAGLPYCLIRRDPDSGPLSA